MLRVGTNQEACNTQISLGKFAYIFNLLLNQFKLDDFQLFLQLFLLPQVVHKAGRKMYYNTPENFNSLGLKVLMLSKH